MAELTRRSALLAGAGATAGAGMLLGGPLAHAAVSTDSALQSTPSADELFTYNGTPALGTLVASIAAENGTDSFGNSYLEGETAYAPVGTAFVACQNSGGTVTFYTAATEAGPWTRTGLLQLGTSTSPGIGVIGPSGDKCGEQDAANIQQALNAFPSVLLLPGMFYLSAPLTMSTQFQVLSGSGPSTVIQDAVKTSTCAGFTGSALIMPSASSQRVTNLGFCTINASFIDFGSHFMDYFECDHIQGNLGAAESTAANDIFTNVNLHQSNFHDLVIIQNNPDKHIWTMGNGTGMGTIMFRDCKFGVGVGTAMNRTVPAFDISLASSKNIDVIRFVNVLCNNMESSGNIDNTQYFFDIANTGNNGNDNDRIEFSHCASSEMIGGFIRVQSTWGISIEHVSVGNVLAVGAKPLNKDIIRIQTSGASGHPSGAVRIVNYHREAHTGVGQFSYSATSASPCVFTVQNYPGTAKTWAFDNNEAVSLSVSPPPGGFSNGTTYWVVNASKTMFSLAASIGEFAYTATSASPCVFTAPGSAFANNDAVCLSGTPPTNFLNGTTYWVVNASGATFELAATRGGSAINSTSTGSGLVIGGTPINSTSTGSGTVTSIVNDIFISDDTTQVYIETPNAVDPDTHPIQISLGAAPYAANVQIMNPPMNAVIVGQNDQTGGNTIVIGNGQITIGSGVLT